MKIPCCLFWVVFAAGFLGACSLSGPLREDQKAAVYSFKAPSNSWKPLEDKADADEAWLHASYGATLSLRSLCFRYEHISLKNLNQNIVGIVNDGEILSQNEIRLDGREALDTVFTGQLDGVRIETRHVVLKKNHCIFDFTLSQRHRIEAPLQTEFDIFLKSFHFEGGALTP